MSIKMLRHHRINCDSCNESEEFTGCSNIQAVRFIAYKQGWRFQEGKSYCQNCSQNVQEKSIGCDKTFETDLVHKNRTKDKLVCRCGGEDGLCNACAVQEASKK